MVHFLLRSYLWLVRVGGSSGGGYSLGRGRWTVVVDR